LVANIVSYQYLRNNVRQSIIDRELPAASSAIQANITKELLPHVITASMMADDLLIKQWLLSDENQLATLTDHLNKIKNKYQAETSFVVSAKSQFFYNAQGEKIYESEQDPNAAWYFQFRDNPHEYALNSSFNTDKAQTQTLFINHKIFNNKQFIGVAGVGVKLTSIQQTIEQYRYKFDKDIYFIDASLQVIEQSKNSHLSTKEIAQIPQIASLLHKSPTSKLAVQFEYENSTDNLFVTLQYIPQLKWWLLITQSESRALSPIKKALYISAIIDLVIIVFALILIFLTINYFHRRLEALATTDSLTGLGNRQTFEQTIKNALYLRNRTKEPISIILIDVDKFKNINDQHGHLIGDKVLKSIALILNESVRKSDYVGRWGGEEFVILAHNCQLATATILADKIRQSIQNSQMPSQQVTVSIGVSEAEGDDSTESLLNKADKALYQAKENGRNCVIQYTD